MGIALWIDKNWDKSKVFFGHYKILPYGQHRYPYEIKKKDKTKNGKH